MNDRTKAVRMAQGDIKKVIGSFKELGDFMDHPSKRTEAKHERIANAPDNVKALLDQGFTQEFVGRLAKLVEDR